MVDVMTRLYTELAQSYIAQPLMIFFEAVLIMSLRMMLEKKYESGLDESGIGENQNENTHGNSIVAPNFKPMFLQKLNEESNGKKGD